MGGNGGFGTLEEAEQFKIITGNDDYCFGAGNEGLQLSTDETIYTKIANELGIPFPLPYVSMTAAEE